MHTKRWKIITVMNLYIANNTNKLIKTTHNKQSPIDTKAQVTESDYDAGSGTKKSQGLGKISDY